MMKKQVMGLRDFATLFKIMDEFPKQLHDFNALIAESRSPRCAISNDIIYKLIRAKAPEVYRELKHQQ